MGAPGGAAPTPNFAALNGSLIRQLETLDFGDMAPNEPMTKAFAAGRADLRAAVKSWLTVSTQDRAAFNDVLSKNRLPIIPPAASALVIPAGW